MRQESFLWQQPHKFSVHTSTICSVSTQLATFPSASAPRTNNRVPTRSALRLRTTISHKNDKMLIYSVNFNIINGAVLRIPRMNLKRCKKTRSGLFIYHFINPRVRLRISFLTTRLKTLDNSLRLLIWMRSVCLLMYKHKKR